jgi:hypothetical protein
MTVVLLLLSLWHFWIYLDKFADLQGQDPISCVSSCVAEVGYWQSNSMTFALWGLLFGITSAAILFFKSRRLSGTIVFALGSFVLYGLIADSNLCALPDDRGLWEPTPACTTSDYYIPAGMMGTGAFLIGLGSRSKVRLTLPQ